MDSNVNYTLVGAFVLILTACIVMSILWLSSGFSVESYSTYKVYMEEAVTGLTTNSSVEYNGVNVGVVKSIELNHKDPQLVELLLDVKKGTPITVETVARLQTRGVTGITYIALKDDSTDLTPLKAKEGEPYPVIKTAPSFFLQVDTAITTLTKSLSRVSEAVTMLLNPENQRLISDTLKSLDSITKNLAKEDAKISTILNNTAQASQNVSPALQTLNMQTLPAANQAITNLNTLSNELRENPSILIRGTHTAPGPGEY